MPSDLVLLVADRNTEHGVAGLLARARALGTRPIDSKTFVHPRRDPGCYKECHDFLRPFHHEYAHALVMFDRVGCGREDRSADVLAAEVQRRLSANGWNDRANAIVLDPELETWVFVDMPRVAQCLGWRRNDGDMTQWLKRNGLWQGDEPKPGDPREAFERVLRHLQRPRSSATYGHLAKRVDFRRCTDPAFAKLREVLGAWFPLQPAP